MRQTRNESNFETALRLTKLLKDNEDSILGRRTLDGSPYLDSKLVLDALYEGITAKIPDPPKTLSEALARVNLSHEGYPTEEEKVEVFSQFPNFQSFVQSIYADGEKPTREVLQDALGFYGA